MTINLPFIDAIWRARGALVVDEEMTPAKAFERLDPMFQLHGTRYAVDGDTLTYTKENPTPQDRLATFTRGSLKVEAQQGRIRVSYDVRSHALLYCFLAPLLFLSFAGLALGLNVIDPPKEKDETEESAEADEEPARLHWIDQMLGAPEPDNPDEKDDKEESDEDEVEPRHSPTSAYVLAGIFFLIYCVGRFLEPFLLRRTLRRALTDPDWELPINPSDRRDVATPTFAKTED
ncbi:MAG: hypothetical protein WBA51_00970 [Erythrobacter sp.]